MSTRTSSSISIGNGRKPQRILILMMMAMKITPKSMYLKRTSTLLFGNKSANSTAETDTLSSNPLVPFPTKFLKRKKVFCVVGNSLFILRRKSILTLFGSCWSTNSVQLKQLSWITSRNTTCFIDTNGLIVSSRNIAITVFVLHRLSSRATRISRATYRTIAATYLRWPKAFNAQWQR